jgi:hypothetical protein
VSKSTTLAEGQITPSDEITAKLVSHDYMPAIIKVSWPIQPTVCDPRGYAEVAAAAMRPLAGASNDVGQNQGQEAALIQKFDRSKDTTRRI